MIDIIAIYSLESHSEGNHLALLDHQQSREIAASETAALLAVYVNG
jgi:hypothetical protein